MKVMKQIVLGLFVAIFFGSCQTVLENVEVPEIPVKAVVFGNISQLNNSTIIELTKSKPILNNSTTNDFESIKDASIQVTNGTDLITFRYNPSEDHYVYNGKISLIPGSTVMLDINTPILGDLDAEVVVPTAVSNYTVTLDSIVRQYDTEFRLLVKKPVGVNEFYRIEAFADYGDDTVSVYTQNEYFNGNDAQDGVLSMKSTLYTWESQQDKNPKLFIILSAITEAHYKYGKALENYQPDNPFAEPTPLPNNVTGGLGIFTVSIGEVIQLN